MSSRITGSTPVRAKAPAATRSPSTQRTPSTSSGVATITVTTPATGTTANNKRKLAISASPAKSGSASGVKKAKVNNGEVSVNVTVNFNGQDVTVTQTRNTTEDNIDDGDDTASRRKPTKRKSTSSLVAVKKEQPIARVKKAASASKSTRKTGTPARKQEDPTENSAAATHDFHIAGSELDETSALPWRHDGQRLRRTDAVSAGDNVEPAPSMRTPRKRAAATTPATSAASSSSVARVPSSGTTEPATDPASGSLASIDLPVNTLPDITDINAQTSHPNLRGTFTLAPLHPGTPLLDEIMNVISQLDAETWIYFGTLAATSYIGGMYALHLNDLGTVAESGRALVEVLVSLQNQTTEMTQFVQSIILSQKFC
jgi:hypothetical protein